MEFLKDEFRRDGWHFCVICQMVCSYLCDGARKGDIHLVTIKDRVGVSSCLTQGRRQGAGRGLAHPMVPKFTLNI